MNINSEELITSLVSPLIVFPEELVVKNIFNQWALLISSACKKRRFR